MNEKIKDLYLKGLSYNDISTAVGLDAEVVRGRIRRSDYYEPKTTSYLSSTPDRESHNLYSDGSRVIEKILQLTESELIDPKLLLKTHGFDPNRWELQSATNNYWGQSVDEVGNQVTLYQSKIRIKPLDNAVDWEEIKDFFKEHVKPTEHIDKVKFTQGQYLVLPMFDLHFGNSSFVDYWSSLCEIVNVIRQGYEEILIISGGDILNEDNYNGTTASGTVIEKTDITKAWKDAFRFMEILIKNSLEYANKVSYMYIEGNHDTFSGHTIQLALEERFSNNDINFDVERGVYKATLLGNNFIATTHGHKSRVKNYPQIFATEFSKLWGNEKVKNRECFMGHFHTEWSSTDDGGLLIRRVPTKNKLDKWHKDSGFVTGHKRFMVCEYTPDEIKKIYYI